MHEEAIQLHIEDIRAVMFQVFLYITVFQLHCSVKNILVTALYAGIFLWWTSITSITIISGGLLALFAAFATNVFVSDLPKLKLKKYGAYYILVQPFVLYYTLELFIPQTSYPVGYPVSFLIWLLGNAFVSYTESIREVALKFYRSTLASLCVVFFVGFWAYDIPWVAVIIGAATQILMIYFF